MNDVFTVSGEKVTVTGSVNRDTLSKDMWALLSKQQLVALKQAKDVLVELSGIEHIDSAGLAWLINMKKDANLNGVSLRFSPAPDNLYQLAVLSGVDTIFQSN